MRRLTSRRIRPHRLRSFALLTSGAAVTGLFGYLAIRDVRFDAFVESLRGREYWLLVPSALVLAAAIAIRGVRWWVLFPADSRPPFRPVVSSLLIGYFFNNILPARAGEAARVVSLHQLTHTSRARAAATVVLERTYDVVSLLVLLFAALPWLPNVGWLRSAATLGIGLALVLSVAIMLFAVFGDRALRFALTPIRLFPRVSNQRIEQVALRLAEGFVGLRSLRIALAAFVLSLVSWVVLGVSAWVVLVIFDLELSPLAGLFVMIAVGLAMILPSSPAAIGVFEGAVVIALGAYDISSADALSCALVLHVVNFVPFITVGLVVMHYHARAVKRGRLASAMVAQSRSPRAMRAHAGTSLMGVVVNAHGERAEATRPSAERDGAK